MGCDIHIYREKLVNGQWATGDAWTSEEYDDEVSWSHDEVGGRRNYNLFSVLARVRCDQDPAISFQARGLPLRMSAEVVRENESWGVDGHSHSHLYLCELEELLALLQSSTIRIAGMKSRKGLAKLRQSIASGTPDWDLLYPYWKLGIDAINYESFEVNVPADYLCGKQLKEIVDGLKEIGGEMQRIVFWFDN